MTGIAYLFPGQGSQVVGMGKDLATTYAVAADTFAEADDLLGFRLSALCFEGPEADLNETINTQPALLVTSVAVLRSVAAELGALPPARYVAGHSLGEYSALVAAGVLTFPDALRLVRLRGRLMGEADQEVPGGMAAIIALDDAAVDEICAEVRAATGGIIQVANYNSPGQVVISGAEEPLLQAMALASERGARKVVRLPISIAAHSPLMAPAAAALGRAISETPFKEPQIPVIGNINALPLTGADDIRRELIGQLTASVRWENSVRLMAEEGVGTFVELGSGNVLTGLVKRIAREATRVNVADAAGIAQLGEAARLTGSDSGPAQDAAAQGVPS